MTKAKAKKIETTLGWEVIYAIWHSPGNWCRFESYGEVTLVGSPLKATIYRWGSDAVKRAANGPHYHNGDEITTELVPMAIRARVEDWVRVN